MWTITFAGIAFALAGGYISAMFLWRGAERRAQELFQRAQQLLETISLSNQHNDEYRKIAKRERKYSAQDALAGLLP